MNAVSASMLSDLIRVVARLFGLTWRIRLTGRTDMAPYPAGPVIYAIWHEHILPIAFLFRGKHPAAIASPSRDGLILSRILEKWTFTVVNGSSSRGGMAAIRESLRLLARGRSLIITPDGPRGPRRTAKSGIAQIATMGKVSVVVIHVKPNQAIRLSSWDRFQIPLPFSHIDFEFQSPLLPLTDESADQFAERIATLMNADGASS